MELHEDPEALEELLFMKVGGGGLGPISTSEAASLFPKHLEVSESTPARGTAQALEKS